MFDLKDVNIIPTNLVVNKNQLSDIDWTDDINIYCGDNLPLYVRPSKDIISENNYHIFLNNKINVVLPSNVYPKDNLDRIGRYYIHNDVNISTSKELFLSHKLKIFEKIYLKNSEMKETDVTHYVSLVVDNNIDIIEAEDIILNAKEAYRDRLILMVGNVSNPKTFALLASCGADYIRLGLLDDIQDIGYPMGSLIRDCIAERKHFNFKTKIICDNNLISPIDIVKALVVGADYVMINDYAKLSTQTKKTFFRKSEPEFIIDDRFSVLSNILRNCLHICGLKDITEFIGNTNCYVLTNTH